MSVSLACMLLLHVNLINCCCFWLFVQCAEAVADILGAPDLHIDEGSTLRLECRLKRATENPAFVFW